MTTMRMTARFLAILLAFAAYAQVDQMWLRHWEDAQRGRPASIASVGRIAPMNERGTPLVVHGRVLQSDGVKPAAGVIVFAYQTDATGVYNVRGVSGYRLRGWAKSDAQGRFEFQTIRPASYPTGRNPAHIHITIEGPGLQRRWTKDVMFLDDPFVNDDPRAKADARPVTTRGGVQHVDYTIRIADTGKF